MTVSSIGSSTPAPLTPGADIVQSSTDIGTEIAVLLVQNAHQNEETDRALRDAAENMQRFGEKKEIDALHNEANLALAGGIAQGTLTIGAAAFDLKAGLDDSKKSAARYHFAAQTTKGSADVVKGTFDFATTNARTESEKAKFDADHAKDAVNDAKAAMAEDKKNAASALDFAKEWTQESARAWQASITRV